MPSVSLDLVAGTRPSAEAKMTQILRTTDKGLHCPQGDFYIDPWHGVRRAVVTHAHSDHARWGSESYLAAREGAAIFHLRLGREANFDFVDYGEVRHLNGVRVSLHPAGHMAGAAQVRIEYQGEVCVVSGDYKLDQDPTCRAFEPVRCHTFVTESTFGLPIYRWQPCAEVFAEINAWWRASQQQGKASLLYGYTVGKAQRLLAGIDAAIGPIFGHGAIVNACQAYHECGVQLPEVQSVMQVDRGFDWSRALIVAPPSANGTPWMRRFGRISTGMASGWMRVRGIRRRKVVDRGFVLSDHVDWPGMLSAIRETRAENIWVTHGYVEQVAAYLKTIGFQARALVTQYGDVEDDDIAVTREADAAEANP
jgi:putative mRNA 3-end processing factor